MLTAAHLEFIARLYELPTARRQWSARLDEYSSFLHAKAAAVLVQDPLREWMSLQLFSSLYDTQMMEDYNSRWVQYEQHGYDRLVRGDSRGFVSDREACGITSNDAYAAHPPAVWFRERYQVGSRYASKLNTNGAWVDLLAVNYGTDRGPMSTREKALGEAFLVHFAKVVELQRVFMLLEQRHRAALEVLDRLDIGVLIASADGSLLLTNRVGEQILSERDTLRRGRDGRLSGDDGLVASIADVAATAASRGACAERLVQVERRSRRAPYLATVSPMRETSHAEEFRGAIVFLIDPANPRSLSTHGMDVLYDLTTAESETLKLLVAGRSTEEISDIRSVSTHTVRDQVKNVLSKTRSRHRSDLVRLAATVNPPVLEDDEPAHRD